MNPGPPSAPATTRTHLKNVFWPNIFVAAAFQILDNHQVACGLKRGSAAILNQNPILEMGSMVVSQKNYLKNNLFAEACSLSVIPA